MTKILDMRHPPARAMAVLFLCCLRIFFFIRFHVRHPNSEFDVTNVYMFERDS